MTRPDLSALAALLDKIKAQPDPLTLTALPYAYVEVQRELLAQVVNTLPALIAHVRELERERVHAIASARRDAEHAAALAMRERCAQACDMEAAASSLGHKQKAIWQAQVARRCAAAVRALGPYL